MKIQLLTLCAMSLMSVTAAAGPVYKCRHPSGHLVYQDKSCSGELRAAPRNDQAGFLAPTLPLDGVTAADRYEQALAIREEERAEERLRRQQALDREAAALLTRGTRTDYNPLLGQPAMGGGGGTVYGSDRSTGGAVTPGAESLAGRPRIEADKRLQRDAARQWSKHAAEEDRERPTYTSVPDIQEPKRRDSGMKPMDEFPDLRNRTFVDGQGNTYRYQKDQGYFSATGGGQFRDNGNDTFTQINTGSICRKNANSMDCR